MWKAEAKQNQGRQADAEKIDKLINALRSGAKTQKWTMENNKVYRVGNTKRVSVNL